MLMMVGILTFQSCSDEPDMIIIDNVPLKIPALYMVGDAAPCGWDINACTPMKKSEADGMVFEYEGQLNAGEFKLPLAVGNWGCSYLMPIDNGCAITTSGVAAPAVQLVSDGSIDYKWKVEVAGEYLIQVSTRDMTITATYKQ